MKFKKTSIIGVIFTLSLVLAVTAAFASEPKQPDEYDSVKVTTSVEPGDKTPQNDIVWVPDIEGTKDIQSDYPEVDPNDVDLSMMRERLAQKAAAGEITQEDIEKEIARVLELLEQACRGEAKLFMGVDANGEDWLYGSSVGKMYYKDENGNLIPIDPGTTLTGYAVNLPDDSSGDILGERLYDYETVTDSDTLSDALFGTVTGGEAVPVTPAPDIVAQPLVNTAPTATCGVEGCTETRNHVHANGCTIPVNDLGVEVHTIIGDPCPVEGCTISGCHVHNGVNYRCNGYHSGGVCDGSCLTFSQPTQTANSGNYSNSGHHGESHHSSGHHNGHH